MTDRPMIFSGPMVRALLEGRKTQTRRVIKPRRHASLFDGSWADSYVLDPGNAEWRECEIKFRVGDRIWVKETWENYVGSPDDVSYRATIEQDACGSYNAEEIAGMRWRSPIFMPRWASRLTLVVTDVRVQRLQEISRGDAMDEGCPFPNMQAGTDPREWYRDFWNSLNAKRGYSWDANPWVVALTLEVHRCNIDQMEQAA